MKNDRFSAVRRTLITLFGLSPLISQMTGATQNIPTTPCSFRFDASHSGVVLTEQFLVTTHRRYFFTLDFLHKGGEEAKKLADLLDPKYLMITKESANSDHPIVVDAKYMAENIGGSLTERNMKMWVGFHEGKYVQKPTNLRGAIPVQIHLFKIDEVANEVETPVNTYEYLQGFSGGNGHLSRRVAYVDLMPGVYKVRAESIQESPLFFDVPIEFGITYYAKEAPL